MTVHCILAGMYEVRLVAKINITYFALYTIHLHCQQNKCTISIFDLCKKTNKQTGTQAHILLDRGLDHTKHRPQLMDIGAGPHQVSNTDFILLNMSLHLQLHVHVVMKTLLILLDIGLTSDLITDCGHGAGLTKNS